MAEFSTNPRNARVDMTPMVDLGFLLITFFMFTTTFSDPNVFKLNLPENNDSIVSPPLNRQNTLSLILGKDNKIYWHQEAYTSLTINSLKEVGFEMEVRNLILAKRNQAKKKENFTVIIHPTDDCNYKNTIDILDEMIITNQQRYVLADINPYEKRIYELLNQGNPK